MEKSEIKNKVNVGDIICYRVNLVRVSSVEDDGCWIKDPYGLEQKIDWEDVETYNKELSEEEPATSFSQYLNRLFAKI